MVVEYLTPDLIKPVPRLAEEGYFARKALAFEELGHPAIQVDDLDPGRTRVQMPRAKGP